VTRASRGSRLSRQTANVSGARGGHPASSPWALVPKQLSQPFVPGWRSALGGRAGISASRSGPSPRRGRKVTPISVRLAARAVNAHELWSLRDNAHCVRGCMPSGRECRFGRKCLSPGQGWCASRAPARPETTGPSRSGNPLNKRNPALRLPLGLCGSSSSRSSTCSRSGLLERFGVRVRQLFASQFASQPPVVHRPSLDPQRLGQSRT
jgi:hypothetical protein